MHSCAIISDCHIRAWPWPSQLQALLEARRWPHWLCMDVCEWCHSEKGIITQHPTTRGNSFMLLDQFFSRPHRLCEGKRADREVSWGEKIKEEMDRLRGRRINKWWRTVVFQSWTNSVFEHLAFKPTYHTCSLSCLLWFARSSFVKVFVKLLVWCLFASRLTLTWVSGGPPKETLWPNWIGDKLGFVPK